MNPVCPLRDFLTRHAPAGQRFDVPCDCGRASSNCTKKGDTCD